MNEKQDISFEEHIEKIKLILEKLNQQDLNLKEGLTFYKEGMKELQNAQKLLENAKIEYQMLKNENKEGE